MRIFENGKNSFNKMNILFCIPKLEIGGAEVFLVRLINEIQNQGHQCVLFETTEFSRKNSSLKTQLNKNVFTYRLSGPLFFYKVIDKLDKKTKSLFFRTTLVKWILKKIIARHKILIINTHVFFADFWVTHSLKNSSIPVIITMHGCYESGDIDITKGINNLNAAKGIIYIADKNLLFVKSEMPNFDMDKFRKIYNGMYIDEKTDNPMKQNLEINIAENSFVFIMVARGIREKGWEIAINAFNILNLEYPDIKLWLVGESEYLKELKIKNINPNIIFLGQKENPFLYMKKANVGLLPTYYKSESLPNSIAEYLYSNIPVIASDIGEIKNMISTNGRVSGIILNNVSVEVLIHAMKLYLDDKELYMIHKKDTKENLIKFDMKVCASNYLDFFQKVTRIKS